jgi:hypothetical protein
MNDEEIQDATVLAVQEPHARRIQGRLLTTPMSHYKSSKMVPTTYREGRWAIRSMLWINKDVEAEQVLVESPDTTAAMVRLPDRIILVASVYVPGCDPQALRDTCNKLRKAITETRRKAGTEIEVAIQKWPLISVCFDNGGAGAESITSMVSSISIVPALSCLLFMSLAFGVWTRCRLD